MSSLERVTISTVILLVVLCGCVPAQTIQTAATIQPTIRPTNTPSNTPLPPTPTSVPVPYGVEINLDEDVFGEEWLGVGENLPIQWTVPQGGVPRYRVSISTTDTLVEDCSYSGDRHVLRIQVDAKAIIKDSDSGTVLAEEVFIGARPVFCTSPQMFFPNEKNIKTTGYPSKYDFEKWLLGIIPMITDDLLSGPVFADMPVLPPDTEINSTNACNISELARWHIPERIIGNGLDDLDRISGLTFSPDAAVLAIATHDGYLYLWNVEQGRLVSTVIVSPIQEEVHRFFQPDQYSPIIFSPDGGTVSIPIDGTIYSWDITSGRLLFSQEVFGMDSFFSTDGMMALDYANDHILLWHTTQPWSETSWEIQSAIDAGNNYWHHVFSPSGTILVIQNKTLFELWDTTDNTNLLTVEMPQGKGGKITEMVFSPDETLLALGTETGWIHMWNINDGELLYSIENEDSIIELFFTADNSKYISSIANGSTFVRRTTNGSIFLRIDSLIREYVKFLDGFFMISYEQDGKIVVWEENYQSLQICPRSFPARFQSYIAISPDIRLFAIGEGKEVKLFGVPK